MVFRKKSSVFDIGKPFIAAYSKKPFAESKNSGDYPDYRFFYSGGLYWCVRIGNIDIPWGIADNGRGFCANGSITVSRLRVDATSIDGKGYPFVKKGNILYLFEYELSKFTFEGFTTRIRDQILVIIQRIADETSAENFPSKLENELRKDPGFNAILEANMLTLERVRTNKVVRTTQ